MTMTRDDYVPAAGKHWLLFLYDPLVALTSREGQWRGAILDSLALEAEDTVVDVGCGTGTLAVMAKGRAPNARVIGVDPDPRALARAERKAKRKGMTVDFRQGFGDQVATLIGVGKATKAVSSMVLHHMPRAAQLATITAMRDALAPGGSIRIADFPGGHFNGPAEHSLIDDLAAAGFENARTLGRFRVAFAGAILVGAEKPTR